MSVRKRNEFLEDDESEDDIEQGYDSDAQEESRGDIGARPNKRPRFDLALEDESLEDAEDDEEGMHAWTKQAHSEASRPVSKPDSTNLANGHDQTLDEEDEQTHSTIPLKKSTPKQVLVAQKAARKSGVVYISRVPPFMKPQTLKHFLAPYASKGLGRIFLTPEDHASHTRRVKSGGNKKKSFTDGWVEFASKREAKLAAETLNGNIIGGKKGNFYHDDLWSMKYLKGFKWSHLTEQIANENAERAAKMREEIRKTRKENKAFVEDVEKGKMLETMEAKRKIRLDKGEADGSSGIAPRSGRQKVFKQKTVQQPLPQQKPSDQMTRMQRMIF
jgi:ESF2/ABP1 family protein